MLFIVRVGSLALALAIAAACTPNRESPPEPTSQDRIRPAGTPIQLTRLRAEPYSLTYYSGLRQPTRLVVRDRAAWEQTWSQIWANTRPVPELPAVNFANEMLIVAALGERASGGYSIIVESARATDDGIEVQVRSSSPGARCGTTAALSQPVDVARLPRSGGTVTFSSIATVTEC